MSSVTVFLEQPRGRDVLRVSTSDYKGRSYVDLRVWYVDRDGELHPTAKGVSLRLEAVDDVIEALSDASNALGGRNE